MIHRGLDYHPSKHSTKSQGTVQIYYAYKFTEKKIKFGMDKAPIWCK